MKAQFASGQVLDALHGERQLTPSLTRLSGDFRIIRSDDLDLRPIWYLLANRVYGRAFDIPAHRSNRAVDTINKLRNGEYIAQRDVHPHIGACNCGLIESLQEMRWLAHTATLTAGTSHP